MKKILLSVIAISAVLFAASCTVGPEGPAGPDGAVVVFQNGVHPSSAYAGCEDVYLRLANPGTNYESAGIPAGASSPDVARILIKFDVSYIAPSNAEVTGAYIVLRNLVILGSNTLSVYPLTRAWNETQATWNSYSTGNLWTAAGGDFETGSAGTVSFDASTDELRIPLTPALVKSWISDPVSNYGVLIKASNETTGDNYYMGVDSENAIVSYRPTLVVEYTLP